MLLSRSLVVGIPPCNRERLTASLSVAGTVTAYPVASVADATRFFRNWSSQKYLECFFPFFIFCVLSLIKSIFIVRVFRSVIPAPEKRKTDFFVNPLDVSLCRWYNKEKFIQGCRQGG